VEELEEVEEEDCGLSDGLSVPLIVELLLILNNDD